MNVDTETFPQKKFNILLMEKKMKESGLLNVKPYDPHTKKVNEIYSEYEKQCQREGVADFPELLLGCYELLKNNIFYQRTLPAKI